MKPSRWMWVTILVGICSSVAVASQTPVDPTIIVNRGTGYPDCSSAPGSPTICLTDNSLFNPIVEKFNNGTFSSDFAYINTKHDLTTLFIAITGVPEGTPYTPCQSDIFLKGCTITPLTFPEHDEEGDVEPPELITVLFVLSGGTIPKFVPGGTPFTFGVDQVTSSATPEPGTWTLFATGILAFAMIGFRRKRCEATALS
jgi:hypothetical protein